MIKDKIKKITLAKLISKATYIYKESLFPALLVTFVNTKFFFFKHFKFLFGLKKHNLPRPLIISLTSFPARFKTLHLTLKCLLMQKCVADKLILWIAYPDKDALISSINNLQKYGLEIRFCDDLISYKKIIPCLKNYPDSYIVTADDDLYYDKKWLEELVYDHKVDVNEVIGHRAHHIKIDGDKYPISYKDWDLETNNENYSEHTFLTTGAGVIFPPNSLHKDVTNSELFMQLCPRADDVWLYWMTRLNGTLIRRTNSKKRKLHVWASSQEINLYSSNLINGGNDEQIKKINEKYKLFGN